MGRPCTCQEYGHVVELVTALVQLVTALVLLVRELRRR
jgi:hypothetical protein